MILGSPALLYQIDVNIKQIPFNFNENNWPDYPSSWIRNCVITISHKKRRTHKKLFYLCFVITLRAWLFFCLVQKLLLFSSSSSLRILKSTWRNWQVQTCYPKQQIKQGRWPESHSQNIIGKRNWTTLICSRSSCKYWIKNIEALSSQFSWGHIFSSFLRFRPLFFAYSHNSLVTHFFSRSFVLIGEGRI